MSSSSPKPSGAPLSTLPPLPAGVSELKFSDFFVNPVGPRGLELTEKLRALDGQRVRILGYMIRQESPPPGAFLLSPLPLELHEHDDHCFIDDLPPSTVHVFVKGYHEAVPHRAGLLLLTGALAVGSRLEADGRTSLVRLTVDQPKGGEGGAAASPGAKGPTRRASKGSGPRKGAELLLDAVHGKRRTAPEL